MRARHLGALVGALAVLGTARSAHAASPSTTWVSGVGDDFNPCSRFAPCKTFAGAIAKTATGGTIVVLDQGAFGTASITSSLTIMGGPNLPGGMQLTGAGNAIVVNAGASDRVVLRGLRIVGDGTAGSTAIAFHAGRSLLVEDVTISGFERAIDATGTANASLFLSDVRVSGNGTGLHAESSGTLLGSFNGTFFDGNATGVEAAAGAKLSFFESSISGNTTAGLTAAAASDVNLEHVELARNATGLDVGGGALVRASRVAAPGNTTNTATENGGGILSFGDNRTETLGSISLTTSSNSGGGVAGSKTSYALSATTNGFLVPVIFSCTGLPAGASCATTGALPFGTASGAVGIDVTTTAPKTALRASSSRNLAYGGLVFVPLLLGLGRRKKWRAAPFVFLGVLSFAGVTTACGDDSSATAPLPDASATDAGLTTDAGAGDPAATPPGSYPFKVVATSGPNTGSIDLTLIVQ